MQINGGWRVDTDGVLRPLLPARLAVAGEELPVVFLVDTGADRTVLGSAFAEVLRPFQMPTPVGTLGSAAGEVESFTAEVRLLFTDAEGRDVAFTLSSAVLTNPDQANLSLLGRDVLDYFAVICDREHDVVALIRRPHTYSIHE